MTDQTDPKYQYNPFCPLEISAQEIAEGYVRYFETSHLSKRQKMAKGIDDDQDYVHAMFHAVETGPLEIGLDACEIIANKFPESDGYEQLVIGQFGSLLNSMAEIEAKSIEAMLEQIVESRPLNKLAIEVITWYLSTDAKILLNQLRLRIAKRRKWLDMPTPIPL
ncbi:hypothetical protein [Maritalea porphyrae]|uniref:hypothetical protein n=1 Tax=Maritalea porphyrae TaxID=880732 RepID=UPI0022AFF9EE|nr:hypothetical protein [Maritalea porphyrae]MCZ4273687.1 hypothetical protein [Maritalea porphyrae]